MMRLFALISVLFLAACGGGGGGGGAVTTPPTPAPPPAPLSVSLEPAFPNLGFEAPMFMLQPPGDDTVWFLVEREGRVWRFVDDDATTSAELVVDISNQVSTRGEGGLLGMTFHPDFAANGRAYLSYTAPLSPLESRVSEFLSLDGGLTLSADTERILLTVLQDFSNHNGGHVAFGPDGFFYFGLGDGGSGNDPLGRAQDATNLLGTIVRIDVDGGDPYGIPADNPSASNSPCLQGFGAAFCPEIYAWGLRNPWRFSFDRVTGELWVGDVGQVDWEEIDLLVLGGNYGWPVREGAHCNPNLFPDDCVTAGFIDPVAEYPRDQGQSITGGYVYRGGDIEALVGDYVFGDFVNGRIWRLVSEGGGFELDELLDTDINIASFAESSSGELYVLGIGGGLYRLVNR